MTPDRRVYRPLSPVDRVVIFDHTPTPEPIDRRAMMAELAMILTVLASILLLVWGMWAVTAP